MELLLNPIDLPNDVIDGLLHKGGKMVIGGGSKSFKTWQLIDMATAVATGTEFLGFPTTAGYDLTTGWGSPKAAGYVAQLAAH